MKTLFVHITDLHFKRSTFISPSKLSSLTAIILKHNPNEVVFLLGGDLSYSGHGDEYDKIQDCILNIKKKLQINAGITLHFLSVPGNHDIEYKTDFVRNRDDIKKINNDKFRNGIQTELERFKNYNEFADRYIFLNESVNKLNDLLFKYTYNLGERKVSIYLLNNSSYGYFDPHNRDYDNDKGLMHLPYDYISEIKRENNELSLLLMHYPLEYFNDVTISNFLSVILGNIDFVFTGHVHVDIKNQYENDKHIAKVISSGAFNNNFDETSEFNILVVDTSKSVSIQENYNWSKTENLYFSKPITHNSVLNNIYSYNTLKFNSEFLRSIYKDNFEIANNVFDYFTFPKLVVSNNYQDEYISEEITNFQELQKHIGNNKVIEIFGEEQSGKSTLLSYIHKELSREKLVCFFNPDDVNKLKSYDILVKRSIEDQYELTNIEQYKQIDKSLKIALIDDFDIVEKKHNIIEKLLLDFDKVIVTRNKSLIQSIGDYSENEELLDFEKISLDLDKFLLVKRDELVTKIYKALCKKTNESTNECIIEENLKKFNSVIQHNLSLFTQSPFTIIMLAKFLYRFNTDETKNIYNDVFTSNLLLQINATAKKQKIKDTQVHITCLQKLAYEMNKKTSNLIDENSIGDVIKNYNEEYNQKINLIEFIHLMEDAHMLKKYNGMYGFVSKDYLAYFASREYVQKSNYWEDNKCEFESLLKDIFFGVNDKILLFLAFTQQNQRIIDEILKMATTVIEGKKEINFNEFPLLTESKTEIDNLDLPSKQEKLDIKSRIEKIEDSKLKKDKKNNFNNFNDLSLTEFEKEVKNIVSYMKLASIILPNFSHNMRVDLQRHYADLIFRIPNVLLYSMFHKLNEDRVDFIEYLYNSAPKRKDRTISKKELYDFLVNHVRAYVLAVYDAVAQLSLNSITKKTLLSEKNLLLSNHRIEKLMFLSYDTDNRDEFKEYALHLYDLDKKDILTRNCVKLIVRRVALDFEHSFINHHNIIFLRKFFNEASIKDILAKKSKYIE